MSRSGTRSRGLITLLVLLALALAACGSAGVAEDPQAVGDELADGRDGFDGVGDGGAEQPAASAAPRPAEEGGEGGRPPLAAPIEQRIVKTGEITVEVPNVAEALSRVRAMTASLNGYVGGSQAGTLDDRATLTLRIPAASFDEAIAQLHELEGEVKAETTREQDVTTQVVDLRARIDNLRASEASYRELVARAERVDDILAVQSRLDEVRGQIEQLTAQLEALEGQAALSTLTVTLVPRPEPIAQETEGWNPGAQLDQALASLVGIGQALVDGLIWFGIVWLPILLVLALLVLVTLRGVLEVRRRLPSGSVAGTTSSDR